MAFTFVGSLSVGGCVPGVSLALTAAFSDLQARLTALLAFNPAPILFTAQLELIGQMLAGVQTMITLGIPAPSISAQIAIVAALVVELEAQVAVVLNLTNALTVAGVFAYAYDGRADGLGPAATAALSSGFPGGGPADATNALVLATVTPACWTAMQIIFKTTP